MTFSHSGSLPSPVARQMDEMRAELRELRRDVALLRSGAVREASWLRGARGGGESKFFRYTLTADMGTSSTTWVAAATADLVGMGNSDDPTGVVVVDVLGNAAWQTTGGRGICVLAGETYWVLTPECEPDEEVIPDPP